MASTLSTDNSRVSIIAATDAAVKSFFDAASKRTGLVVGVLVAVLVGSAAVALFINHQATQSSAARNALYLAQRAVDADLKAASAALPAAPAPVAPNAKDGKAPAKPATPDAEAAIFKKLDVDTKFADSLKKLHAVADQYPGTRSAFEADLESGDLYFNHGEAPKALGWYQKALEASPDKLGKVFSYSALGYANEDAGKPADALANFQKALDLGEGAVKGDVMMGMARSYEALKDTAKARSTYDQVISQLPGSEYAKSAETYRAQLK